MNSDLPHRVFKMNSNPIQREMSFQSSYDNVPAALHSPHSLQLKLIPQIPIYSRNISSPQSSKKPTAETTRRFNKDSFHMPQITNLTF